MVVFSRCGFRLCSIYFLQCKDQLYGKKSRNHPEIYKCLQKGMEYVQSHTPEEIAEVIAPQFAETDLDTVTAIVKRYYDQDTWKSNLIFEKESFELWKTFWKILMN